MSHDGYDQASKEGVIDQMAPSSELSRREESQARTQEIPQFRHGIDDSERIDPL